MEQRIVSVHPTDDYFSITWELGIRCNYDCMYCPPKWHNNTSKHHSLETLQESWTSIYKKTSNRGLPYKISFTGGEVTSSKHFLPFVKWLRTEYSDSIFQLLTTTNGSATLKYYKELFNYIDNISFSVHSEHINEQKFFEMIVDLKNAIKDKNFLHVNIMDELWNRARIPKYQAILETNSISYNINEINYNLQTRTYPIFKGVLNLAN